MLASARREATRRDGFARAGRDARRRGRRGACRGAHGRSDESSKGHDVGVVPTPFVPDLAGPSAQILLVHPRSLAWHLGKAVRRARAPASACVIVQVDKCTAQSGPSCATGACAPRRQRGLAGEQKAARTQKRARARRSDPRATQIARGPVATLCWHLTQVSSPVLLSKPTGKKKP